MDNKDLLNEQIYDHTRASELIRQRAKALGISRRRLVQCSFTYDELLSMPSISVIKAVECAGNGRSFYLHVAEDPQFTEG